MKVGTGNRRENRKDSRKENVRRIKETLLDLLYPPRCPICDEVQSRVWKYRVSGQRTESARNFCCPDCETALSWIGDSSCIKCGRPLEDERQEYCGECMTQRHFFDRGVAAFAYTASLRHSLYRMKAENRRDYIPFYAAAMTEAAARFLPRWRPQIIVPVPMHPRKRRRRGYNQSELLARELSRRSGIPVEAGLLRCTRLLPSQKELGRKERLGNLRGSFIVCEPFPPVSRVLLVDDVYTTGSTMDEISRVLRQCGVREIYFVVLCTGKGKKAVCTAGKV